MVLRELRKCMKVFVASFPNELERKVQTRSGNGCGKLDFFEIGSGFGEPGGTLPRRIPRSTPPGL